MGKFIGIGAGAVVGKDGQVEGLGGLVQVEEKDEERRPFEVDGKETFESSQTAASKPNPKQERRRIRKEKRAVSALESVVATGQHQIRRE